MIWKHKYYLVEAIRIMQSAQRITTKTKFLKITKENVYRKVSENIPGIFSKFSRGSGSIPGNVSQKINLKFYKTLMLTKNEVLV